MKSLMRRCSVATERTGCEHTWGQYRASSSRNSLGNPTNAREGIMSSASLHQHSGCSKKVELWREDTHGARCRVAVFSSMRDAESAKDLLEREVHKQHYEIVAAE